LLITRRISAVAVCCSKRLCQITVGVSQLARAGLHLLLQALVRLLEARRPCC
jgi:hypothetical protein